MVHLLNKTRSKSEKTFNAIVISCMANTNLAIVGFPVVPTMQSIVLNQDI